MSLAAVATAFAQPGPSAAPLAPPAGPVGNLDLGALLDRNGCLGCHGTTYRIVGPAYAQVAKKYRADPNGLAKIEASINGGSIGKWGQVAMPAFRSLTPSQLEALAQFVMKQ